MSNIRSIYSELFRYQPSQRHTPTENFLTQALADLLNRMIGYSREAHDRFIREVLLSETSKPAEASLFGVMELIKGSNLEWVPQITASEPTLCRIDLVLLCDRKPVVVVENKLGSGYTDNQLSNYCDWIKQIGGAHHAVVLLTRWTPPPDDFLDDTNESYRNSFRAVCWWGGVYRWLMKEFPLHLSPGVSNSSHECAFFLAREFCQFLEEELNVNNSLSGDDFKCLEKSLRPLQVAQSLVKEIKLPNDVNNYFQEPRIYKNERSSVFLGCAYQKNKKMEKDWWVGWGLILEKDFWEGYFLDVDQPTAIIIIGAEAGRTPLPIRHLSVEESSRNWQFVWDDEDRLDWDYAIKKISVDELLKSDPHFEREYRKWTNEGLKEAAEMLKFFASK